MATTYEKIASTTLGSAALKITFSTIPATYTDLRLVLTATTSVGGQALSIRFNSDTGSNYSRTNLIGNGSSATSTRNTSQTLVYVSDDAVVGSSTTIPLMLGIDIFSYAGNTFKTFLVDNSQDQNGSGVTVRRVGLWRSTSAITTIEIGDLDSSWTLSTGTTATLYGILKA